MIVVWYVLKHKEPVVIVSEYGTSSLIIEPASGQRPEAGGQGSGFYGIA
jgi:hypothetical protein